MKAWHGALLLVAGFAAGFAAAPRGDPAGLDTLRDERDALKSRADRAEAELAAARDAKPRRPREGVDLPKGAVAPDSREPFEEPKPGPAAAGKPDAPSTEARAKRLNEIRGAIAGHFAAHEGDKLLGVLKELAALGPDARDDAMKLAIDINADVRGAGELRLSMFTFYSSLGDPAVTALMTWSLANQASSPPDFRVISAYSVPWVTSPEDAIARFDAALAHEGDRSVQRAIVENLSSMNTPKAESLLARVFADAARDAELRADAAMALAGSKDPAIQRDIETAAASDPQPRVQEVAKLVLIARDPPATGCLVTQTLPESNADAAGIRAGDVLVSYNGRPVPTADDLRREIGAVSGPDTVPVVVVRDGREQTLQVKPGRLGLPNLRPVTKK